MLRWSTVFWSAALPRTCPLLLALGCTACGPGDPLDSGPAESSRYGDLQARLHEDFGSLVHATWQQADPGVSWVEYSFQDEEWLAGPSVERGAGLQQQLLLGVPYDVELSWRVVGESGVRSGEQSIHTDPLPEATLQADLLLAEEGLEPSLRYLLVSLDGRDGTGAPYQAWTFIVDRQGRVVWALDTPAQRTTLLPRISKDGADILVDHNSFWASFDGGAASQVQRMKLEGTLLATYDTPGLHHSFTDLPDGSLAWGSTNGFSEVLALLPPAGEQQSLWSCSAFYQQLGTLGTCAANTLEHDEASDSFMFSFFSSDSVVQIDASSGETLRWFGQLEGAWGFDPEGSAFWWQHGAHLTDQGTLLLSTADADGAEAGETLAREYELDLEQEQLRQIWSFGAGQGIYAEELGEAHRLPGGNTLHNYGTARHLREIGPQGELLWELHWPEGGGLGRSTAIEDLYALLP